MWLGGWHEWVYQGKAHLFLGHAAGRRARWDEALRWYEAALALGASYGDEVQSVTNSAADRMRTSSYWPSSSRDMSQS